MLLSSPPDSLKTHVEAHNGLPTFFVDGKPHHGLFSSAPAPFMRNVLEAGFDIVDTHPQTSLGWSGPKTYDYTATDARIESYLEQSADAKLIIRFWPGYPGEAWWADLHPEEAVTPFPQPEGGPVPWEGIATTKPWGHLIAANEGRIPKPPVREVKPSFASRLFREEAGEAICRAVAHIEGKYGDRIAGYVTGGGPCGEWFHWFADQPGKMDYGAPMLREFRAFLRERYGNVAALNRAWKADYAGFDAIGLPAPAARFKPSHGNLRSAAAERPVLDFYDAYHRVLADTLLHWAAKTKEGCSRRKAVMIFYGYLWNHNYGDAQARSGHACLETVLRSPDVDAIVAPFCYSLRQMDGVITGQGVAGSARRHGKLYVHELDGSTNLIRCWNSPHHHNPHTAEETGELFRRELNKMLCEGSAGWYMDLKAGYFNSPEVVAQLRRTLEIGARLRPRAGRPNAQVAVVLDPRTPFYFREGEPFLSPLIDAFKQHELARLGLGFDDLTLEDLLRLSPEETAQYKLWIFPSAVHLTPEALGAIRAHACRNGNHVVWNYAVNVCGMEKLDLDGMERATGFRCGVSLEPGELSVRVRPGSHPWTANLPREIVYGTRGDLSPDEIRYHAVLGLYATNETGFQVSPRFFIREGGEALGVLEDLPGNPCGLAVRALEGWVSVLSCAPLVPRALLRRIACDAGCHVYTEFPAQVTQCENHVGLFFHEDGPCTVRLPFRAARVSELYSGDVLGEDCDAVTFPARRNHAVLIGFEA